MKPVFPIRRTGGVHDAGFTLLEIAVVCLIIGLIATLVVPYVGIFRSTQIKGEVRRLAGRATFLYQEAAARKLVIRLTFDMDNNRYFAMVLDPYSPQPTFAPDVERGAEPVRLPNDVKLRDVTVEGVGLLAKGTTSCIFYPEGWVDGTVVHLVDITGTVFTLAFAPLTGRVSIAKGDLSPQQMVSAFGT